MPVITVGSFKGGTGKTTSVVALASEIRAAGSQVHLIDTDPEASLHKWYQDWEGQGGITAEDASGIRDDAIEGRIAAAAATTPFVIIDVAGTANDKLINAAAASDLLIIPQRASALDFERTVTLTRKMKWIKGARDGRDLPYRVLITQRSPAISSKPEREVLRQVSENFPVFSAELFASEAYRSMFLYRMTLDQIEQHKIAKTDSARRAAKSLLAEIIEVLQSEAQHA